MERRKQKVMLCHIAEKSAVAKTLKKNNYADLKMERVLQLFGGACNQIKTDSFVWPCLAEESNR